MKKTLIALISILLLLSCNNSKNESNQSDHQENLEVKEEINVENLPSEQSTFDIGRIPVSNEDIGDFPFFNAPEGSLYINRPKVLDFDFIVFVTPDSIFEVEGKAFRSHVHQDRKSETQVSGRYLNKSFEEAILKAGGVKVFEGRLRDERIDRYKELCTYAGSNGSIDIWNNEIATYIIRRTDGNVYIAIDQGKRNTTSIQILQEKAFKQTITKITSDKIEKELVESGKSVLHINFDTDKATLKPDGLEAVQEIIKVLNKNTELKIAINGYTDNSGSSEYNKKLSENRALTVKNEIVRAGIDTHRLTSKGFGQENPIADNSTEEGKSKNRRVELIKL